MDTSTVGEGEDTRPVSSGQVKLVESVWFCLPGVVSDLPWFSDSVTEPPIPRLWEWPRTMSQDYRPGGSVPLSPEVRSLLGTSITTTFRLLTLTWKGLSSPEFSF